MSEELEKLRHKQYVAERKLTAAKHKEKRLQSELKRLTRSERSHIEYLLDVLLYGTTEEKKALVAEQRKEVMNLEQRFAEHPDEHDRGGSQRKSGLDR